MKRVLVTGASGFVGRHCLPALAARGFEVHAVSSRSTSPSEPPACWHRANLFDADRVNGLFEDVRPNYLLHLAWTTTPGACWTSPDNLRWVQASLHMLEAFAAQGGQRLVTAGSCAEYDWSFGYCCEQTTPLRPSTLYGKCKYALSVLTEAFAEQAGLSTAWARLFFLYGPHAHERRLPAAVISALVNDRPARCSHAEQIRDYLHVRDAASALTALLDSQIQGPMNVASGDPVRLKEMIYATADLLGRRDRVELGAVETAKDEPPLLVADVRRLQDELAWSPRYELRQGLEETVAWWTKRTAAMPLPPTPRAGRRLVAATVDATS